VEKTEDTIYLACEPKPPSPAPSQFNKAEGKLFLRLQSRFQRIGNNILFSSTDEKLLFSLQKKGKNIIFVKKKEIASFLCRSTNYSSFALLVLLLNLFHNGAGFSETFNHFSDCD